MTPPSRSKVGETSVALRSQNGLMVSPVLPLFVIDGADLAVYPTIADACGDLEAIHVNDGEYDDSFDSDGYPVEFLTLGYAVVGAQRIEGRAPVKDALIEQVRQYARALGPPGLRGVDVETADLASLADAILAFRPERFRWRSLFSRRRQHSDD